MFELEPSIEIEVKKHATQAYACVCVSFYYHGFDIIVMQFTMQKNHAID